LGRSGAFEPSSSSHTCPPPPRCYCYSSISTTTTYSLLLPQRPPGHPRGHHRRLCPPPSTLRRHHHRHRLTLARPARLHSNSSRCATETSASLLRQIPAVLPFFTLDGPDICCPGMLQQDTPSPPSPSPSPHTLVLLSCRTHVSNRTPEPPSRSAIGVRFPIHRHPPHPFAIESHLPSRTLHALVRPRPRRETRLLTAGRLR
jgi:hypothetical protein